MSFENLLKTLEDKAAADENTVLTSARLEAKRIKSEASSKAKQLIDEAKTEGQKLGEQQRSEISANAKLRQKRVIAEAREKLIGKAITGARDHLDEFVKSKQYATLLEKLAKDCAKSLGSDALLYCKKQDEKTLRQAGFKIAGTVDIIGGVIGTTSDKKIKVNNSLEALLENHEDQLKQTAFQELASVFTTAKNAPLAIKNTKPKVVEKKAAKKKLATTKKKR